MRRRVALRRLGLIEAMRGRGITVAALAQAVGVSARTVKSWRQGQTSPVDEMLPRVAKVLRVSEDRLDELLDAERMRSRREIEERIDKARAKGRWVEAEVLEWVTGKQ